MKATFICDNPKCQMHVDVKYQLRDGPPKNNICGCGSSVHREYSKVEVNIPDYMKATEDGDNFTSISKMMEKGQRPSGKERIFY